MSDTMRPSMRSWSKGSARGEGPKVATGVVYVERGPGSRLCRRCGNSRPDTDTPHAARLMRNPPEGWPTCEHGTPVLADCRWQPTTVTACSWLCTPGGATP
ncbi:MAG TPA: hypothetical protein VNA24_03940 [Hyalangium sp.]|nr:hypothetical protein [Hyalangium sp.]